MAVVRALVSFCLWRLARWNPSRVPCARGGEVLGRVGVFAKVYAVVLAAEGNRMRIAVAGCPRMMKSGGGCPGR